MSLGTLISLEQLVVLAGGYLAVTVSLARYLWIRGSYWSRM